MGKKLTAVMCGGGVATVLVMAVAVSVGAVSMPWRAIGELMWSRAPWIGRPEWAAHWPAEYSTILFQLRLPRVAMGAVTGAGLALAGALFQTLLRNPLGDPYLLGVSSGAGFGATLAIAFGATTTAWGFSAISVSALLSACGAMGLVYLLARAGGRLPVSTLILSGVVVSSVLSAATLVVATLSESRFAEMMMWLMGRVEVADPRVLYVAGGMVAVAGISSWGLANALNAMRFGEETAGHLGVRVERMKLVVLGLASAVTAVAVSATGLIGFVGLMVPHAVRGLVGSDHRLVIPASLCGGAILLVLADALARTLVAPVELPVGVVTALVGGPFFLFLLRRERKAMSW